MGILLSTHLSISFKIFQANGNASDIIKTQLKKTIVELKALGCFVQYQ